MTNFAMIRYKYGQMQVFNVNTDKTMIMIITLFASFAHP